MNRKALPALLTVTYMYVYSDKMDLIKEVIKANLTPEDKLQKIGFYSFLAEQIQPLLFVINLLEIFLTQMENEVEVYESGRFITLLNELQKKIAYYKESLSRPFSETIYNVMQEAQKSPSGQLAENELNNHVLLGEGGVTNRFYKLRGSQLEACLETAPKATLTDLPILVEYINTVMTIDTTQPAPLVKQELEKVMEKLTILV